MATGTNRVPREHFSSHCDSCGQTRPQIAGNGLAERRILAAPGMSPAAIKCMKSGIGILTGQPSMQTGSWHRKQRSASNLARAML